MYFLLAERPRLLANFTANLLAPHKATSFNIILRGREPTQIKRYNIIFVALWKACKLDAIPEYFLSTFLWVGMVQPEFICLF